MEERQGTCHDNYWGLVRELVRDVDGHGDLGGIVSKVRNGGQLCAMADLDEAGQSDGHLED